MSARSKALRTAALIALGVGFGAFALGPLLHQIGHDDDHVHVGGAVIYEDAPPPSGPEPEPGDEPPKHRSGGLLHFGVASTVADALLPSPAELPRFGFSVPELEGQAEPPPRPTSSLHRARAPPRAP